MARAGHPAARRWPPRRHRATSPSCPPGRRWAWAACPSRRPSWSCPRAASCVLYTDGLIEDRDRDIDVGLDLLRDRAGRTRPPRRRRPARPCSTRCRPSQPSDDVALLVARTRALDAGPGAPTGTCPPTRPPWLRPARAAARQLADWGLDELAFTTELVVSELVTNAIRYGAGPIRAAADPRPHPDLRGLRQQQHRAASAPGARRPTRAAAACSSSPSSPSAGAPATPRHGKVIWAELAVP